MKVFVVLTSLLALALAAGDNNAQILSCSVDVAASCASNEKSDLKQCNSLYSGFAADENSHVLDAYANGHIKQSYVLLLMSIYYGNYVKNRPGFEKLYKDLADKAWNDGVDIIKHIGKRGGVMDFNVKHGTNLVYGKNFSHEVEVAELRSLGVALDIEKDLAISAHRIHEHYSHANNKIHYDPEIAHYMEEEFIEDHADTIRKLSGYANDLKKIIHDAADTSLGVFIFDEYLQKQ